MRIALVSTAQKSGCPPIGLVYLASYIHKYTKHRVHIVDANYVNIFDYDYIRFFNLIGISAMSVNYGDAIMLARQLKSLDRKLPIIIGGVHISTCPESFNPIFDSMIIGEGEESFFKLLQDYPNIKPKYETLPVTNLDDLTPPDWSLLDKRYFEKQFNTTFAEWGIEGWLLTSRGCPYNCVFCSTQKFWGNKIRYHSIEYVVDLIRDLEIDRGVTHIQIWDDLFTINKARLKELAEIYRWHKVKFNCQPRINTIDDEMCRILKDSNITLCIFGFESGNTRVLRYLKNDISLNIQRSKQAIKLCRKYSLDVQGSVMFGSPTETLPEMFDTLKFMLWCYFNGVQRLWAFVATPFPATEFWQYAPKDIDYSQLSHHTQKPLLLDKSVKLWQFRIVMFLAHRIEGLFKLKKLWKMIKILEREGII